jgi:hypothetical protein
LNGACAAASAPVVQRRHPLITLNHHPKPSLLPLSQVWLMLKAEIMAPAGASQGQGSSNQLHVGGAAAAAALCACVQALGPGQLDRHVIDDVAVEDLRRYLGLLDAPWLAHGGVHQLSEQQQQQQQQQSSDWDLPERAQRRVACIASAVAAVS